MRSASRASSSRRRLSSLSEESLSLSPGRAPRSARRGPFRGRRCARAPRGGPDDGVAGPRLGGETRLERGRRPRRAGRPLRRRRAPRPPARRAASRAAPADAETSREGRLGLEERPAQRLEDRRVERRLVARDDPERPEERGLERAQRGPGREDRAHEAAGVLEERARPLVGGPGAGSGRARPGDRPATSRPDDEARRDRRDLAARGPGGQGGDVAPRRVVLVRSSRRLY